MSQQEAPHPSIAGHHSCLTSRGMEILLGLRQMIVAIGTLVIEGMHALELLVETGHIAGVADIGIATRGIGRRHQTAIGDHLAIGHRPVGTVLDITYLTGRNAIAVHHLTTDMGQGGLLLDEIATAGHTVFDGDALHLDAAVLIDHLTHTGIDWMEDNLEIEVAGEELDLPIEFRT